MSGRSYISLAANRIYFSPFYVDRPTELTEAFVSQYTASSISGSVLRTGIFRLGEANGNSWDIGEQMTDMGVQPADIAGNKQFSLATPLLPLCPDGT